jgi:hypothetical protein
MDDLDLDTKWIEEFDSLDEKYKEFYSEDINSIRMLCLYVNSADEIEKMKTIELLLKTPNYISREEIIGILKKNYKTPDKSYTVLSILKYNIDVDPSEIQLFLNKPQDENIFLKSIKNIDAIPLDKSISMFQDLNEIIIIFYEKPLIQKNAGHGVHNNQTKRIFFKTIRGNKKRTYRKMA